MDSPLRSPLLENPTWSLILRAYAAAEQLAEQQAASTPAPSPSSEASEADNAEGARRRVAWVRRLGQVEGVPSDRLAPLHGRLIAEGLLHFSLGGREEGVLYRVSREARQALDDCSIADDPGAATATDEESRSRAA